MTKNDFTLLFSVKCFDSGVYEGKREEGRGKREEGREEKEGMGKVGEAFLPFSSFSPFLFSPSSMKISCNVFVKLKITMY